MTDRIYGRSTETILQRGDNFGRRAVFDHKLAAQLSAEGAALFSSDAENAGKGSSLSLSKSILHDFGRN